ncbi:MAG: 30S ribosome-binding factor RbfA [Acidobacteriota bacterium]
MSYRADRMAQEMKVQISLILAREMRDPRIGLATVTDARMSPDLRYARVFVSVLGSGEEQVATLAALNQAAGFIRRQLGPRLRLRHNPEITFCFDQSVEQGARMEEILAEVKKERPDLSAPEPEDNAIDASER